VRQRSTALSLVIASLAAAAVVLVVATSWPTQAHPCLDCIYSVRDFGAVGDGVTDDYIAIQRAIDACGTSGGQVVFPAGTYYLGKSGAGGLKLPAGNKARLVLSGCGATIKLSGNVPRFLDFDKTADYQTFACFMVQGFAIDAGSIGGWGHVVGFTSIDGDWMPRINVHDITVKDVTVTNVASAASGEDFRKGISIEVAHNGKGEATNNYVNNIIIENVRITGGATGFAVAGQAFGGWAASAADVNIDIDNVTLSGCTWDSGVRGGTWMGNGALMGLGARGGTLRVQDCVFKGSGDNGLEVNGWHDALIENVTVEDSRYCGFFVCNLGWPQGDPANQQLTYRNCTYRTTSTATAGDIGWSLGNQNPLGTVTLDGCAVTTMGKRASDGDFCRLAYPGSNYTIKALNFLNCGGYTGSNIDWTHIHVGS